VPARPPGDLAPLSRADGEQPVHDAPAGLERGDRNAFVDAVLSWAILVRK
jgi:hypothetical protein